MSNKQKTTQTKRLMPGYLQPYLDAFINTLSDEGYATFTKDFYYNSVAHFGTWLEKKCILLGDINYSVLNDFAKHRCYCLSNKRGRKLSRKYSARVKRFILYLYEQGDILSEDTSKHTESLGSAYVEKFIASLQLRGFAPRTISQHEYYISKLLPQLGADPANYTGSKVRQIICDAASQKSICEAKKLSTVLRAYLRFLATEGVCCPDLDKSILPVAEWKLSALPKYISNTEMERVVDACNTSTPQGIRDRAIVLLLCRLALRAGDVSNMRIDDINWEQGLLHVRGKSRQEVILPLPQDVGDAISDYIAKVRPSVNIDILFLCLNAPYRPFPVSSGISSVVSAAVNRAGIVNPPSRGAHLLRHSAATHMLRQGATLEAVSSVLRHRSLDMTGYYAKVDIVRLKKISQPWPENASC